MNGLGPLDGFLSRRCPAPSDENMVIDLTADNNFSPAKCLVLSAPASPCPPKKDNKHEDKDETTSSVKSSSVDHTSKTQQPECTTANKDIKGEDIEEKDGNQTVSVLELDLTQDSDSEQEEQNESGNVSSLGNKSMLSNLSVGSSSECSPEKIDVPTPTTTHTVCCLSQLAFLLLSYYSVCVFGNNM